MHGYALTTAIEENFGWKPSQTAIYNILKGLEEDGAVASEERVENGRLQKIYAITPKGSALTEEHKKKFKTQIVKMISFVTGAIQHMGDQPSQEELTTVFSDFRRFPVVVMTLIHQAPKETHAIISTALDSLTKLAKDRKIPLPSSDDDGEIPCPPDLI